MGGPPEDSAAKQAGKRSFEEALKLYFEREFDHACRLFEDCLERHPDDTVARIYVERCEKLNDVTLPADWDGITEWNSK